MSGCGREGVDGTYRRGGLRDGVPCYKRVGGGRHKPAYTLERTTGDTREWSSRVKVLRIGSASARLLRLLRVRPSALGSSALPERGLATGRPAATSGARARRLQSRPFRCLCPSRPTTDSIFGYWTTAVALARSTPVTLVN